MFFCIPAHGHTNPTLNVVRELVNSGNDVWYYSYNSLKEKIEGTGAKFISCDEYDCEQNLSPEDGKRLSKDLAFSTQVLVNTTLALDEKIAKDIKAIQPDCIVADSMAVWGKLAALKFGIPFVSSTTTFAFNKHSSKIMKQGMGDLFKLILSMRKVNKEIKRLKTAGYPIKSILDIIANDNDTNTIVYTSPEFQPCADTFSNKYVFVGPSIRPKTCEAEKTRDKLIYISMGTVNNDMAMFYHNCISALKESDYQVIISVGEQVSKNAFDDLPDNICVYTTVDQIAVLEKADVFITHCGMNSVSESLYYGVPLVMFPKTSEQGGVAQRVLQLGAGIMLEKQDAASIKKAVEEVLSEDGYKKNVQKIADGFKRCVGAKGAADKIIKTCKI